MRRAVTVFVLATAASIAAAQLPGAIEVSPAPGRYPEDVVALATSAARGATLEFRWDGAKDWALLDRPLDLSAFPNEERVYSYAVRAVKDGAVLAERTVEFRVDKRPPAAPAFSPTPGGYRGDTVIRLSGDDGARIMYRIVASGLPTGEFVEYAASAPPALSAPGNGIRRYSVVAYAVDDVGNAGRPEIRHYFVSDLKGDADGAAMSVPETSSPKIARLDSVSIQLAEPKPGTRRIVMGLPEGASCALVAVNPRAVDASRGARVLDDFVEIAPARGQVSFDLGAPYLWNRPLILRYGYRSPDGAVIADRAVEIGFSFDSAQASSASPPAPVVSPIPEGEAVMLSWPPFSAAIFYSVDSGEYERYRAPVFLDGARPGVPIRFRYYGETDDGMRSAIMETEITPPPPLRTPPLFGVPETATASRVRLRLGDAGTVRYENSAGSRARQVSSASPLFGDGLSFDGEDGKSIRYQVRVRAFSDASPGAECADEDVYEFVIDREPPPVPRFGGMIEDPADPDRRLFVFSAGDGTVFASVTAEGDPEAPFVRCGGTVPAAIPPDRSVRYFLRAYAVDEAGNRSADMERIAVFIDRSSVYAADWGDDRNPGTSAEPVRTVERALETARSRGLSKVCLSGAMELSRPIAIETDFELSGSFDRDWNDTTGAMSVVTVRAPGVPVTVRGARFAARGIRFRFADASTGGFVRCESGSLTFNRVEVIVERAAQFAFATCVGSTVVFDEVSASFARTTFAFLVDARDSEVVADRARIAVEPSVQYFTAFASSGSDVTFSESRIDSSASSNFSAFATDGGSVRVTRSLVQVRGGTGECRLVRSRGTAVTIDSSVFLADWPGALVACAAEGGSVSLYHDTFDVGGRPKSALFVDLSGGASASLANSIFASRGAKTVFLKASASKGAGATAIEADANCLSEVAFIEEGSALDSGFATFNERYARKRKNFTEPAASTFGPALKGVPTLGPASACLGAAIPLGSEYSLDFYGFSRLNDRNDGKADVGAIESKR